MNASAILPMHHHVTAGNVLAGSEPRGKAASIHKSEILTTPQIEQ
jgi:hypothetical protein